MPSDDTPPPRADAGDPTGTPTRLVDGDLDAFVSGFAALHDVLERRDRPWEAGKLWALHTDVFLGCWVYERTYTEMTLQPDRVPGEERNLYGRPEHRNLVVATKALVLFVRAYQDGLAGAAHALAGNAWGRNPRMSKAMNTNALLVRALDDPGLSDYREWFAEWKEGRDRIKLGLGNVTRRRPGEWAEVEFWTVGPTGSRGARTMMIDPPSVSRALGLSATMSRAIARVCDDLA